MTELKLWWEYSKASSTPIVSTELYETLHMVEDAVTKKLTAMGIDDIKKLYPQMNICDDGDLAETLSNCLQGEFGCEAVQYTIRTYGPDLMKHPDRLKGVQKGVDAAFIIKIYISINDDDAPVAMNNEIVGYGVAIMDKHVASLSGPHHRFHVLIKKKPGD